MLNLLMRSAFAGNLVRNAEGVAGGASATPAAPAGLAASAALAGGTPAAAPVTPSPVAASADGNSAVNDAWYASLPPATQSAITAKGWNALAKEDAFTTVLDSYMNLEKLFGADKAGRTVTLPKDDAPPEEKMEFFKKIGVPEKADDYGFSALKDVPPEVQQTLGEAQGWMHKAGVPKMVAENLIKEVVAAEVAKAEAWVNESQKELNALSVELGAEFENRMEVGRRAARAAGLDQGAINSIEKAIGTKAMLKMFMAFGETMSEAAPPAPGNAGAQFTETAESARTQIQGLFADKDFMANYLSPNPKIREQAIAKMERLQKIANGG